MVTATLKDSGPTTTITFKGFKSYDYRLLAQNFEQFPYPDNEGQEIMFEEQWVEIYKFVFQLEDDSSWPTSGDSAADKWDDLVTLIMSGGDNNSLLQLTYDKEDSRESAPSTATITGKVKQLTKTSLAGEHLKVIEGELEFWRDTKSSGAS